MKHTTRYVAGFAFNHEMSKVALIRKAKPKWQEGLLNGMGGKIEDGESPEDAMCREFAEESGFQTTKEDWSDFARLVGDDFTVEFFAGCFDINELKSPEDEKVETILICNVGMIQNDMVENLPWLIALAIDHLTDGRPSFIEAVYP